MKGNLWKTIVLMLFSAIIIYFYYGIFVFHREFATYKYLYIGIIAFLYIVYKAYYIFLEYDRVIFTGWKILSFFLLHLFLLSVLYFMFNGSPGVSGFILFFKICIFLFLISSLNIILFSFGRKIMNLYFDEKEHDMSFQILSSFSIGYVVIFLFLSIIAFLGLYSAMNIIIFLCILAGFSWKDIWRTLLDIHQMSFSFENHNLSSSNSVSILRPYLLSTEFLFIVLTGVIAVSFINVLRPFPIGWDDLGVYMNHPKLLSEAGGNIALGQMYAWELFTGIGFLFKSQAGAFFMNSFSAILSSIVIYLSFSSLLFQSKKIYLNIPLLSTTIFMSLPMVIFQVAKDMKLDIGLFFISFLCLYLLFYLSTRYKEFSEKQKNILLILIGALAGLAFTIKVTSLLLISGIFAVVFFYSLGIFGFIGYVSIYISIFTFFGLWGFMNVIYPEENTYLINLISGATALIGSFCIGIFAKHRQTGKSMIGTLKYIFLIIFGIIVLFLPWGIKNVSETINAGEDVGLMRMIGGYSEYIDVDYTLLYNEEELKQKESVYESLKGVKNNEDFSRYFGYEKGINNYLKLAWNLSMQVNQKGEFTDITYLFLALIPGVFLFLPSKKKWFHPGIVGILIFEILYFIVIPTQVFFTDIFNQIPLPLGYGIILLFHILGLLYLYLGIDKGFKLRSVFLYVAGFSVFFVFLWTISAQGVVWYGIVMYGTLLLLISISLYTLFSYEDEKNNESRLFYSFLIFCIPVVYIFQSTIPHYINNLQKAGYSDYKTGEISESVAIFNSHPEYLDMLFSMNIKDGEKENIVKRYKNELLSLLRGNNANKATVGYGESISTVNMLDNLLNSFIRTRLEKGNLDLLKIQKGAKEIQEKLYKDILYPNDNIASHQKIYRVGTFLKYFIIFNNNRLLEDSLLTIFDAYIFDENPDIGAGRIKKLGIDYLLVDLNAATIDNDPRRDLTRRYENLLLSLVSDKVQLIKSDSICLSLALDRYKQDKNIEDYLVLASVNHNSMMKGKIINRSSKISACHTTIANILATESISENNYPYLRGLASYIVTNKEQIRTEKDILNIVKGSVTQGYKALFFIN